MHRAGGFPAVVAASMLALAGMAGAAGATTLDRHQATATPQDEYITLMITLAEQALREPRLAAPMPCLPHWIAGTDHVVLAVSRPGDVAGLARGDRLQRIATRELTGFRQDVWDVAMRALPPRLTSYEVEVRRNGARVRLDLPCAANLAVELHQAERAMWTAITRRDWTACTERGRDMTAAFGAAISPPLMMMTRCVAAAGRSDAMLTYSLATALLGELAAHPNPAPALRADMREQLFQTLRDLEAIRQRGGEDYATKLRSEMKAREIEPPR